MTTEEALTKLTDAVLLIARRVEYNKAAILEDVIEDLEKIKAEVSAQAR